VGIVIMVLLAYLGDAGLTFDLGTGGSSLPTAGPALTGTVSRGEASLIGSGTSEPGSETTLTAPEGGPAAGLRLVIPGDAYESTTEFTLSATPIRVDGFRGLVTPVSDLITVENGGAYAASPVLVTVPVTIPEGSFAMGVYLHDDGSLEPMPLIDESPTSITIATRHFSSLFITMIAEAALPEDIGTGFRAGEDDIQTPNYGSYVEPGGHCAGQALAALWYFSERKGAGGRQLNGLLGTSGRDETPGFWRDDRLAYRLASSISMDTRWNTLSARLALAFEKAKLDRLQWNGFRYAMLLTGQPQFVGLSEGDQSGGHVIIAYAATKTGLWVADPNYPGKLRDIRWNAATGQFESYLSGATAKDSDSHYDKIAFYGKTALVEWSRIGARWAEAEAGTTGDKWFPDYLLGALGTRPDGSPEWEALVDGRVQPTPQVRLTVAGTVSTQMHATVYRGADALATIYDATWQTIDLKPGVNRLGFFIWGYRAGELRAVDFVFITILGPGSTASPSVDPATPEPADDPTAEPVATPQPEPTRDCSNKPSGGIKLMEWELRCGDGVISTAPP
jgi:hypothetical protein